MSMRHRLPAWPLALLLPIVLAAPSSPRPAARRPARGERRVPPAGREISIVRLAAGEALHAVVERQGAEAKVSLIDPAGREVLSLDSPDWIDGREDLFALAGPAGEYRLAVARTGAGSVRLEIDLPHLATARDRLRAAAEREQAQGDALRRRRTFQAAAAVYRKAVVDWKRAAEPEAAARARYRLAAALEEANQASQALAIDRALVTTWGRSLAADAALNAAGRCYAKLKLVESARDAFLRAASQASDLGDRAGHAEAIVNLAQLDRERDLQAALDRLDEAREELHALGLCEREAKGLLLSGQVQYVLGAWEAAIDAASRGHELGCGGENEIGFLQLLGASYTGQRNWQPAVESFGRLLVLAKERDAREYELAAVAGLGFAYLKQGQLDQALRILETERNLARGGGTTIAAANVLGNLGAVYSRLDRSAEALRCFDRAAAILHRLRKPAEEASILFGKAQALERVGHLPQALAAIENAITKVEHLRTEVAGSDLRASFFAHHQEQYELAVRVLMKLDAERPGHGFARQAFETAERMRSRTLLDELAASGLDVRGRASQTLLAKEAAVQARLERLGKVRSRAVAASAPLARLRRIEGEIQTANSGLEAVRGKMRQEDRLYRSITLSRPLGLRAIQAQVLDDETLLLAYSLGDEESFLWAVGRSSFHVHRLAARKAIEDLADAARRCFVARDSCSESDLDQASARLSDAILRPAATELVGRRLLVVADGALQRIPFAALPDPEGTAGAPRLLIHAHEIVYLTSASLLPMLRRASARPPAPKLVAALGDPVFERDDRRVRGIIPAAARGARDDVDRAAQDPGHVRLPRLAHTREEVEQIAALAPPGLALKATDFAASRTLVMSPEIGSFRYIHLATHVLLDSRDPELTGIVLSRYDAQGHPQDGFLHGYEVYGLKLAADLVVLSACETGLGPEVRGEGLIGLARGFMYAGAPRVLVSLWKVDDHATAELMLELYRGMIQDHLRPAAALRRAQIAVAKKYRSPYDWAAFQLQGDWR